MADYFSLPHLGAGTSEVEGLSSYLTRMAQAHGCSEGQLATHLRAWWDGTQSQGPSDRFPRIAGTIRTVPLCGMGSDVEKLVVALGRATGVATLRSATMMPLAAALASTSIGTLRNCRAWCPTCYEEDILAGRLLYDRLLWAVAPISRCRVHKVELLDHCPSCTFPQCSRSGSRLDSCNVCGASLLLAANRLLPAARPTFGEDLIYELIGACARDPGISINRHSMRMFFKRHRRELPAGDPLLTTPSLTSESMRPSLGTVLRMVTAFGVSLLDFQSPEPPETTCSLYAPASPLLPKRARRRHSQTVRERVSSAIEGVLGKPESLCPFRLFCAKLGVSTGYVRYQFPSLTRIYIARRKEWVSGFGQSKLLAAKNAASSGLIEDYEHGRIKQLKGLIREVASVAGVSIVTARRAVKLCMMAADHEGSDKTSAR